MSIVALKRNSRRFQVSISGKGNNGFALNGTHRNIGAVGVTNLAKSVTRTPFRGTTAVGHGGNLGHYVINIHNSGDCCSNDNTIVKPSVITNKGRITRELFCCATYPNQVAKAPLYNGQQGQYIKDKVSASSAKCVVFDSNGNNGNNCRDGSNGDGSNGDGNANSLCHERRNFIGSIPNTQNCTITKNITVPSSSTYTQGALLKNNCLPRPKTYLFLGLGSQKFANIPPYINNSGRGC